MYFEELLKRISPTLKRITHKLNGHFSFFNDEDLFQEALTHLWINFESGKLSDKTDSYILQGCYFYLKNYLRKAEDRATFLSLDAVISEDEAPLKDILLLKDPDGNIQSVRIELLIEELKKDTLTKREKEVLSLSLEGITVRGIGQKLGVSHVMVIKIKKNIRKKLAYLPPHLKR